MSASEPTKRARQKARREERLAAERVAQRQTRRQFVLTVGVLSVLVVGGVGALLVAAVNRPAVVAPQGVRDIAVGEASHVEGDVTYETTPGAGGPHSGAWQNCGVYTEPVAEENAVHSMEHGAVWLSYRPDLDQAQVQRLAELGGQDYVVVSPLADVQAPVVATAWGKQLTVDSADDPALEAFVRSFAQGPQTLERGAPCTGGIGEPA